MEAVHRLQQQAALVLYGGKKKIDATLKAHMEQQQAKEFMPPPPTCGGAGPPALGAADSKTSQSDQPVILHGRLRLELSLSACSMLGCGICIATHCPKQLVPSRGCLELREVSCSCPAISSTTEVASCQTEESMSACIGCSHLVHCMSRVRFACAVCQLYGRMLLGCPRFIAWL